VPGPDVANSIGPVGPVLGDLALSRARHDRAAETRSVPGALDRLRGDAGTGILRVRAGSVPIVEDTSGTRLVLRPGTATAVVPGTVTVLLGRLDGRTVLADLLPDDPGTPGPADGGGAGGGRGHCGDGADPGVPGARWAGLREVGSLLPDGDVGLAVEAVALDAWHRAHPRCPRCGGPTEPVAAGHERRCPADGSTHHPRSDPAVIMAVLDRADRLLLARQVTWPPRRMSLLAGFVEPGESLEAAVVRETAEEAGLDVEDVRYLGSQPWPFPASLMVGFVARARGTQVTVDGTEIAEAQWFSRAGLRAALADGTVILPPPLSIARRIVEWWAGGALAEGLPWGRP
jgi:NAD+ diphosphatase